jgi:hypothetical protein
MKTLEQLEAELAALPAPLDTPGDWTPHQRQDHEERRRMLTACVHLARNATSTLAEVAPVLADLTTWHDLLERWRALLCEELLTFKMYDRNPALRARKQAVELSLRQIDRGLDFRGEAFSVRLPLDDLMERDGAADPSGTLTTTVAAAWKGSLKTVEPRLRELQRRCDEAAALLAGALMDDDARAKHEAEAKKRLDIARAAPQRKTRGDGSTYDRYPDGRVVEVTS